MYQKYKREEFILLKKCLKDAKVYGRNFFFENIEEIYKEENLPGEFEEPIDIERKAGSGKRTSVNNLN